MPGTAKTYKCAKWILFLGILTLTIVGISIYRRRDSEIQRFIIRAFHKKYPLLKCEIGSTDFMEGRGIRLRSLKISDHQNMEGGYLEIGEIFVECPITIQSLLCRTVQPTHVYIKNPRLYLSNHETIADFIKKYKPDASNPVSLCPIDVTDGELYIPAKDKNVSEPIVFGGIAIQVHPPDAPTETGTPSPNWLIHGIASNPFIRKLEFDGEVSPQADHWSFSGKGINLEIGPELTRRFSLHTLSPEATETFQGKTTFTFSIKDAPDLVRGWRFQMRGEVFRGSLVLNILKHPLSDIFIRYSIDDDHIRIERLTGRSGPVLILAECQQPLNDPNQTGQFRVQLDELPLDNDTVASLSAIFSTEVLKLLDKFDFSTVARVRMLLESHQGKWRPKQIGLSCRQLELQVDKFPYHLSHLQGSLDLDEKENLVFTFYGKEENRSIKLDGTFSNLLTSARGKISVAAETIPLNDKLIRALPESCRDELTNLHPEGFIDANIMLNYDKSRNDDEWQTAFDIRVRNGAIRYERFPYRIGNITGEIKMRDKVWTFSNLTGMANSAGVQATGFLRAEGPREEDGSRFALQLQATGLPLDEQLLSAMAQYPQYQLVKNLNARGKVDANIRVTYLSKTQDVGLEFEASPRPDVTTIRPKLFPYELQNLQGMVVYRKGEIVIENLRATNGQMTVHTGIRCRFMPDGSWVIDVSPMHIDQFLFDREFQSAAPTTFTSLLEQLRLQGYFNLAGVMRFSQASSSQPIEAVWDVGVVLLQNMADWKTPIRNIGGRTRIRGRYVENQPVELHGELNLDSLSIGNVQATGMTGPFYYQGTNLLLGRTVPHPFELGLYRNTFLRERLIADPVFQEYERQRNAQTPVASTERPSIPSFAEVEYLPIPDSRGSAAPTTIRGQNGPVPKAIAVPPVTVPTQQVNNRQNIVPTHDNGQNDLILGRRPIQLILFNGTSLVSGTMFLQKGNAWQIHFMLKDGSLNDLGRDLAKTTSPLHGKVTVFTNLKGVGANVSTIEGDGGIIVKDAQLYELPQIVKLFQILSVQEPDQAAFNAGYIDFHVFGKQLKLDRVVLEGKALTVFGNGWLTLEEKGQMLDLTMNSRLGSTRSQIPVISDVIGGAGDQIAQIRIEGPLSDPVIRADRFPGIKRAWWSIFPESSPEKK